MNYPINRQPTAEEIKKALLPDNDQLDALDELIATGEAVFSILRLTKMDRDIKSAFFQLEKQFTFYANLATGNV